MASGKIKLNLSILPYRKNDNKGTAKYKTVYKCPLCGDLVADSEAQEIPYEALPKLIDKVVVNQQFAGNPYLYEAAMYKKHFCKNGSVGLAFLAGFMRVK